MSNEKYIKIKEFGNIFVVENMSYKWGVIDAEGKVIVPFGKYGWIDEFDSYSGLARVRTDKELVYKTNVVAIMGLDRIITDKAEIEDFYKKDRKEHPERYAKWGIINVKGEEVLPLEYDEIWKFVGKRRLSTIVEKDGERKEISFHDLNPNLPKRFYNSYNSVSRKNDEDYGRNYGEYAGSYAQDVMGFSDDIINDAFDGEPDAYWNID